MAGGSSQHTRLHDKDKGKIFNEGKNKNFVYLKN